MPTSGEPARRRSAALRKGDLREQALLDATETLLQTQGFESMTMNDIARGAGLSRASVYFYFGSKQDVLTALVGRTVEALHEKSRAAAEDPTRPREAVATVMRRTLDVWLDHGPTIRVAIDQAAAVPEIDRIWAETAEIFIAAITTILERAGGRVSGGDASARARALCWMIERSFYHASKVSPQELAAAAATCEDIWLRVAGVP